MSKPVKDMIVADYRKRFEDVHGALVVEIRGLPANDNNAMRLGLQKKNIHVTVVKNTLAKKALSGTSLEAIGPALVGPSALAYGADSVVDVAREIITWAKKTKQLALKGAVLDGEYFDGEAGVKRLSEFPTKDEAQAKVVQLILSPAKRIVKEIQERLEKGEAIAKVG
jgi:large subunit ribosomal protein L10